MIDFDLRVILRLTDNPHFCAQRSNAFFLSCTALQAADVVAELERQTGKPVVTSNQACAWELAHHTNLRVDAGKWGRLFMHAVP